MTTHTSRRAAAEPQPTATVRREPALVSNAALAAAVRSAGYEAEMDAAVILPIEATGSRLARLFYR